MGPGRTQIGAAGLVACAVAATLALLFWQATRHDDSPFLAAAEPAEWILYPMAPAVVRPKGELEAVFTRRFELERAPERARLALRIYRQGEAWLNGVELPFARSDGADWKRTREGDVAALLRPGENEISVRARTRFGPPAVWLALEADDSLVASDASWTSSLMGAEDAPARLARTPLDQWPRAAPSREQLDAQNPRPLDALRRHALAIAGACALGGLLAFGVRRALRAQAEPALTRRFTLVAWLAVTAVWLALFANNQALHPEWGFDAPAHRTYVKVVLQEGRIPLADEGWQTYQPPLYYGLAAAWLRLGGFQGMSPDAIAHLRWLGFAAGALQALFVLLALRELLPRRPGLVLAAFVFASSLPVNLVLFQMVTNEAWVAALASGALWWTIRMLRRPAPGWRDPALLGLLLGLAMLAKFSALIPLVLCPAVVLAQRVLREPRRLGRALGGLATTLAVAFAVCGWHFVRVAAHFGGNPFVGNWDDASGQAWWQDPGVHVLGDYLRFGLSLERPLMSAVAGVPDALYSTLWGDGMLSGIGNVATPPPWHLGWMAAGYALALLPCVALLAGAVLGFADFVRRPRAERFLVLAVLGATFYALLNMTLRLPFYTQAKAFYGLSALVPLAFCFALGFDALALRWRGVRTAGVVWLAGWAVLGYATFFASAESLRRDPLAADLVPDPAGYVAAAQREVAAGRPAAAAEALARALALDPDRAPLGQMRAQLLHSLGRDDEALAEARAALRVTPAGQALHVLAGELWAARGDHARAAFHFGAAANLLPPTVVGHIEEARAKQVAALRAGGLWAEGVAELRRLHEERRLERTGVRQLASLLLDAPPPVRDPVAALALTEELERDAP